MEKNTYFKIIVNIFNIFILFTGDAVYGERPPRQTSRKQLLPHAKRLSIPDRRLSTHAPALRSHLVSKNSTQSWAQSFEARSEAVVRGGVGAYGTQLTPPPSKKKLD